MDQRQDDRLAIGGQSPDSGSAGQNENSSDPGAPVVRRVEFQALGQPVQGRSGRGPAPQFFGITLRLSAELGKITIPVRELINLETGSTLKLQRVADERVMILLNETPFAHGEVVVINERFAVRVTALLDEEPQASYEQNQRREG